MYATKEITSFNNNNKFSVRINLNARVKRLQKIMRTRCAFCCISIPKYIHLFIYMLAFPQNRKKHSSTYIHHRTERSHELLILYISHSNNLHISIYRCRLWFRKTFTLNSDIASAARAHTKYMFTLRANSIL